jgi:WD40 repeat protein
MLAGVAIGGGGVLIAAGVIVIVLLTRPETTKVAQVPTLPDITTKQKESPTPPTTSKKVPTTKESVKEPIEKEPVKEPTKKETVKEPVEEAPAEEIQPAPGEIRPVVVEPPAGAKPILILDAGGPSAAVRRVLFTPDSRRVLLVGADKTARLADAQTGETLYIFRLPVGSGDEGALFAASFTNDGRTLAVGGLPLGRGGHGIMIYLISMTTGQVEKVFRGHNNIVTWLEFSHDRRYLASCSNDGTARIYEVASGQTIGSLLGSGDRLRQVSWSPDDRRLATVCVNGKVRIWTAATAAPIAELKPPRPDEPLMSASWKPDGTALATGDRDGNIQIWGADGAFRQNYKIIEGQRIQVASLAFTPDGKDLLFAGINGHGRAGIFDLSTSKCRVDLKEHDNTVLSGSVSPDGKLAITAGGDRNEVYVWRVADGQLVQKFMGKGASVFGVGWSKDGSTIAWGNVNRAKNAPVERTFRLADLDFGDPPGDEIRRAPVSSNGYSVSVDFFRATIHKDGKPVRTFDIPSKGDRFYSACVIGGDRAVLGCAVNLYLIDLRNGQILKNYVGHTGGVMDIAIRPTDGRYFVTGSADQTVCIWDPEREHPLMSLFVAGQDWIAWTPEGYYAASAYGERLMGWQINNGPEQVALYYPAVQFRKSLYNPDALKLLLEAGSIEKALALAGKEKKEPAPALVNVGQVLPPAVVITSPAGTPEIKVAQGRLRVQAAARSVGNHPVTAMRLLVDGRPWQGQKGIRTIVKPRAGEVKASWDIDLTPGAHLLVVQAESAVSKGVSPIVQVTRAAKGDLVPPNLYVLAVGISAYPGDMALNYAHADAEALAAVLDQGTRKVFGKVEIQLLTDRAATRQKIIEGLGWLGQKMTANDVGIFFFAGHGTQDPRGQCHLVPVDFNPRKPGRTGIPGDALKAALEDMPGRIVAMLDACHSGAVADPSRRARTDDLVRDLVTDDYGVVVMCSSLGREYSLESPATKHGFFTLGILEALTGKADFNHDGFIHIHEVDLYASLRVRQLSRGRQNPVTGRPPNVRSFPLTRF